MSQKALVIDDSRTMRTILKRILVEMSFEIVEAGNGQEGVERLPSGPFDLALVDWNMPVMTGIEFVKAARSDPGNAAMRIVMVTTETETSYIQSALDAGATDFIMKPFTADVLRSRLEGLGFGVPA